MRCFKGFDKDLKCRGFQYEVGKEYETNADVKCCRNGFHCCENPFDVFGYYPIIDDDGNLNRFCEVEGSGKSDKEDNKTCFSKLKVKAEIGIKGLVSAFIEIVKESTKNTELYDNGENRKQIGSSGISAQIGSSGAYARIGSSGDSARIGSSGISAQIGSSGDSAQIGSSGAYAQIVSEGEDSVICCAGHNSAVKAKKGSWITLSEWKYSEEKERCVPVCVKTEYVDGERIKENVLYKLVNGEFTEVKND